MPSSRSRSPRAQRLCVHALMLGGPAAHALRKISADALPACSRCCSCLAVQPLAQVLDAHLHAQALCRRQRLRTCDTLRAVSGRDRRYACQTTNKEESHEMREHLGALEGTLEQARRAWCTQSLVHAEPGARRAWCSIGRARKTPCPNPLSARIAGAIDRAREAARALNHTGETGSGDCDREQCSSMRRGSHGRGDSTGDQSLGVCEPAWRCCARPVPAPFALGRNEAALQCGITSIAPLNDIVTRSGYYEVRVTAWSLARFWLGRKSWHAVPDDAAVSDGFPLHPGPALGVR